MIRINNICPVCDGHETLEFDEDFYGPDFPQDDPWNVVCGTCQDKLADFYQVEESRRGERKFIGIMTGCVNRRERSIEAARRIVQFGRQRQRQLKITQTAPIYPHLELANTGS